MLLILFYFAGSLNDAGIFQWSDLGQAVNNNLINLPEPRNLPGTNIRCPYYIIGDGAFPLRKYLMKPYTRVHNLSAEEEVFNYRLSRARLQIERAFGILTKKWRILESALDWKLINCDTLVMSLICLHKFLITNEMDMEDPQKRYKLQRYEIVNPTDEIRIYLGDNREDAVHMRNRLKDYFMSSYGRVPWQEQYV